MEQNNLIQGEKNPGKEFFILKRNIYPLNSSTLTIFLFFRRIEVERNALKEKHKEWNETILIQGKKS